MISGARGDYEMVPSVIDPEILVEAYVLNRDPYHHPDHERKVITDLQYNNTNGRYEYKYRDCHVLNGIIVKWSDKSEWIPMDASAPKVKYYHDEMDPMAGEYYIDFTLPDWANGMVNTILTVSPIKEGVDGTITFIKWKFINNSSNTVRLYFSYYTSETIYWKIETFTTN